MMTTNATRRARLSGDTFQVRSKLQAHGWKWDAGTKTYYKDDEWSNEEGVIRNVRAIGGIRNRGKFTATLEEITG